MAAESTGLRAQKAGRNMADGSDGRATGIGFVLTMVGPEEAARWLSGNHEGQRSVSTKRARSIANDIIAGNWKVTHQAIAFDGAGRLIDGQHRLTAVVMAGKAVPMYVAKNGQAELHDPIDRGRPRPVGFVAGLQARTSAACTLVHRMEIGQVSYLAPVTVAEVVTVHAANEAWFSDVASVMPPSRCPAGLAAACVWTMPIDRVATLDFLAKVRDGEMLKKGDPAHSFRNWITNGKRMTSMDVALAAMNCLRHHINGVTCSAVQPAEMGYRAACSRRRSMKVPRTPGNDVVVGVAWTFSSAKMEG